MQVKATAPTPEPGTAEYAKLRELVTSKDMFMQVAVALAASDMPARGYLLFDDAVRYAIQGLARIGVEAASRTAYELRRVARADTRMIDAGAVYSDQTRKALRREENALWGIPVRQQNWCTDVAHRLCLPSFKSPAHQRRDPRFVPSAEAPVTAPAAPWKGTDRLHPPTTHEVLASFEVSAADMCPGTTLRGETSAATAEPVARVELVRAA